MASLLSKPLEVLVDDPMFLPQEAFLSMPKTGKSVG
jgi:hypothetical protein